MCAQCPGHARKASLLELTQARVSAWIAQGSKKSGTTPSLGGMSYGKLSRIGVLSLTQVPYSKLSTQAGEDLSPHEDSPRLRNLCLR